MEKQPNNTWNSNKSCISEFIKNIKTKKSHENYWSLKMYSIMENYERTCLLEEIKWFFLTIFENWFDKTTHQKQSFD